MLSFRCYLEERVIPYLYHGTSDNYLASIKRSGLKPDLRKADRGTIGVYFTTEPDVALNEAIATCTGIDIPSQGTVTTHTKIHKNGTPVILVLDRSKVRGLEVDDNYPAEDSWRNQHAFVSTKPVPYSAVVDIIEFDLEGLNWKPRDKKYQKYRQISHRSAVEVKTFEPPQIIKLIPGSIQHQVVSLFSKHLIAIRRDSRLHHGLPYAWWNGPDWSNVSVQIRQLKPFVWRGTVSQLGEQPKEYTGQDMTSLETFITRNKPMYGTMLDDGSRATQPIAYELGARALTGL